MPDVFISYSSHDAAFAQAVQQHLTQEGVSVFLAPISISPGKSWAPEVLNNLRASPWVIFLASRAACASPYVQQELGGAVLANKKIVPIVWDMPTSMLPGWIGQYQAINIAGALAEEIRQQVTRIAEQVKADNLKGLLILGAALFAFFKLAKP